MTPKEKAEELYYKYYQIVADCGYPEEKAKECALIAVDEVMDSIPSLDECKSLYIFWSNVKHELNKQD